MENFAILTDAGGDFTRDVLIEFVSLLNLCKVMKTTSFTILNFIYYSIITFFFLHFYQIS